MERVRHFGMIRPASHTRFCAGQGTTAGRQRYIERTPRIGAWLAPPTQSAVQITVLESTACIVRYPHFSPAGGIHSARPT